jgi:hypothetical protein
VIGRERSASPIRRDHIGLRPQVRVIQRLALVAVPLGRRVGGARVPGVNVPVKCSRPGLSPEDACRVAVDLAEQRRDLAARLGMRVAVPALIAIAEEQRLFAAADAPANRATRAGCPLGSKVGAPRRSTLDECHGVTVDDGLHPDLMKRVRWDALLAVRDHGRDIKRWWCADDLQSCLRGLLPWIPCGSEFRGVGSARPRRLLDLEPDRHVSTSQEGCHVPADRSSV